MDIKDLKDLPNGTKFTLEYEGAFTKYYEYLKVGEYIYCADDRKEEYGIDEFYDIDMETIFYLDDIYFDNPYFDNVRVAKISTPIEFKILYVKDKTDE